MFKNDDLETRLEEGRGRDLAVTSSECGTNKAPADPCSGKKQSIPDGGKNLERRDDQHPDPLPTANPGQKVAPKKCRFG